MDLNQIKSLIRNKVEDKMKNLEVNKYSEFKLLNKVPELIPILEDLMSDKFNLFVKDVEWVAPKPPEYRIVLENGQYFYLADLGRSWVATVEGKRYYLLNLGEEQMAIEGISRILRYGQPINPDDMESLGGSTGGSMESALDQEPETPAAEEPVAEPESPEEMI
jgi:hypothetical protein